MLLFLFLLVNESDGQLCEKIQKKKFHLVDNEYLNAYESTKNDSELMAQLFGEQQNERVYSIELDEMDMEKPKSKGGKNNDLQH